MIGPTSLGGLPYLRDYESRRASSYDRAGGNRDWWTIQPGETRILLAADVPGVVRHLWMTVGGDDAHPRRCVLRMFWDGEANPSVEVPLGDFFGIGHGILKDFVSLPLQMSPQDGRGLNCWWAMPFDRARIELANECENPINLYFYVDWEEHPSPLSGAARFHAQWRRENPTQGWMQDRPTDLMAAWDAHPNLSDGGNYLILEAEGEGVYVGCNLNVDVFERQGNDWYGEGDDMIVIDGEPWPPRLHGTGTEDYFGTAFGPWHPYHAPYHGLTVYSGDDSWPFRGKNSLYRFHIEDPVRFRRSIRVSVEHGEQNALSNDVSSTAYWYQHEPHKPFPPLATVVDRLPR